MEANLRHGPMAKGARICNKFQLLNIVFDKTNPHGGLDTGSNQASARNGNGNFPEKVDRRQRAEEIREFDFQNFELNFIKLAL